MVTFYIPLSRIVRFTRWGVCVCIFDFLCTPYYRVIGPRICPIVLPFVCFVDCIVHTLCIRERFFMQGFYFGLLKIFYQMDMCPLARLRDLYCFEKAVVKKIRDSSVQTKSLLGVHRYDA